MRARIGGAFVLLGVLVLTVDPLAGQPGGGKFGGGDSRGGDSRGGRTPDPERMFLFFSKGAESIDLGQLPPDQKVFVKGAFEKMGLPNPGDTGVITKQQFVAAFAQAQAAKAAAQPGGPTPGGFGQPGSGFGQPGSGYGPPGGFTTPMPPGGFGPPGGGRGMSDEDIQKRFREMDQNQDGRVSFEESNGRTRENWAEVDVGRRGSVDFDEYKAYIQRRYGGGQPGGLPGQPGFGQPGFGQPGGFSPPGGDPRNSGDPRSGGDGRDGKKVEDFSNVAVRYGKLGHLGLPDWFAEYDTDKDGQVNMYEWRTAGGKTVAEFRELDANGDGLIAPQELVRVTATKAEVDRLTAIQDGEAPTSRSSGGSRYPGGGSGGSMMGKGGPPGGMPGFAGKGGGDPRADAKAEKREEKREEKADRAKAGLWGNGGKK